MNTAIIHQQLKELLETIQEQYGEIQDPGKRISMIEFDILRENLRKFYELIHLLQRQSLSPADQKTAPQKPVAAPPPPVTASPPHPSRPVIRPAGLPKSQGRKQEPAEKRTPRPGEPDLFEGEEPVFNLRLREAREASLPSKPPAADHLKSLIGINDKFSFINELFDGNLKEYNEAIDSLNGFTQKQEALGFLDQLRSKNLWELGSGTFMKLKEIVEKYYL